MYQHMQESLRDNLADPSLPPRMHRAIRKGIVKLEHYYDMAKLNHFNVIATGKYFCVSLANAFLKFRIGQCAIRLCAYLGSGQSAMILMAVQRRFLSITFVNIKLRYQNPPHHNQCLSLLNLSHF